MITARPDPTGLAAALIWPIRLDAALDAQQVALQFVAWAKASNTSFEAWLAPQPPTSPKRVLLRTRSQKDESVLDGSFAIAVDGTHAIISGFQAPRTSVSQLAPVMIQLLQSFRLVQSQPRQNFREGAEAAFDAMIPVGWWAQGLANRNNIGNAAICQFSVAGDPHGLVKAVMPGQFRIFTDGWGSWLFSMGTGTSLRYMAAKSFAEQWLVGQLQGQYKQLQVESVRDRPDLLPEFYAEEAEGGMNPDMVAITAACLDISYTEQGTRLRQKMFVTTTRPQGMAATMTGMTAQWVGSLVSFYRAPPDEFAAFEPILAGILGSYRINPAWRQQELMRMNQRSVTLQQDTFRRQREISRTLSETSDIIASGHWERQAIHDRALHQWSNAFIGVTDVADPSTGKIYAVPNDYDQYWRDNEGNILGIGWRVNPDPSWTKLTPVTLTR